MEFDEPYDDLLDDLLDEPYDDLLDEPYDDLLDELVALQRRRAQLAALETHLLVQIAGAAEREYRVTVVDPATERERVFTVVDEAREEIAALLRRSPGVVHDQLVDARLLAGPLAATRDALAAGDITEAHVRVICVQARRMLRGGRIDAEEACRALETAILPKAQRLTPGQTRALARRAVEVIDVEGERARRDAARCTADVTVHPEDDGMAVLVARMRELDARRVAAAVEARAGSTDLVTECDASMGERRSAALVDLVCGTGAGPGPGVEVQVTVSLAEFVDPVGPLGHLLDDPSVPVALRRLLTDPRTGGAIDLGRTRYQVSDALRRWIAARDRTCTFPGCSRRAEACDIDHVVAWEDGGPTDGRNLQALCRRHHQLKTFGLWEVEVDPEGGGRTWISPRGRRHRQDPPQVHVPDPDPPPF